MRLVSTGLATPAYVTVATIRGLSNVLDQVEGFRALFDRPPLSRPDSPAHRPSRAAPGAQGPIIALCTSSTSARTEHRTSTTPGTCRAAAMALSAWLR